MADKTGDAQRGSKRVHVETDAVVNTQFAPFEATYRLWLHHLGDDLEPAFRALLMYSHRFDGIINHMLRGIPIPLGQVVHWFRSDAAPHAQGSPAMDECVRAACQRARASVEYHPMMSDLSEIDQFRGFIASMISQAHGAFRELLRQAVPLQEDLTVWRGVQVDAPDDVERYLYDNGLTSFSMCQMIARETGLRGRDGEKEVVVLKVTLRKGTLVTFPWMCSFYPDEEEILVCQPLTGRITDAPVWQPPLRQMRRYNGRRMDLEVWPIGNFSPDSLHPLETIPDYQSRQAVAILKTG
jgi:hypothetical protein